MNKIQKLSSFMLFIFKAFFIIYPLTFIMFWINPNFWRANKFISFIPKNIEILHLLTTTNAILGFLVGLMPTAVALLIFYFLIKLFTLYKNGEIFTFKNVDYIRKIGIMMLLEQAVNVIHEILMGVVLTFNNPEGKWSAGFSIENHNLHYTITAVLIIFISWIMKEGVNLKEEQNFTV